MAKKGNRFRFRLKCTSCGAELYDTTRNKINTTEALKIKKYCQAERKYTEHKEVK